MRAFGGRESSSPKEDLKTGATSTLKYNLLGMRLHLKPLVAFALLHPATSGGSYDYLSLYRLFVNRFMSEHELSCLTESALGDQAL